DDDQRAAQAKQLDRLGKDIELRARPKHGDGTTRVNAMPLPIWGALGLGGAPLIGGTVFATLGRMVGLGELLGVVGTILGLVLIVVVVGHKGYQFFTTPKTSETATGDREIAPLPVIETVSFTGLAPEFDTRRLTDVAREIPMAVPAPMAVTPAALAPELPVAQGVANMRAALEPAVESVAKGKIGGEAMQAALTDISSQFNIASEGRLRQGQTVVINLGDRKYEIELRGSIVYVNNEKRDDVNEQLTLLEIITLLEGSALAGKIADRMAERISVGGLHYEVGATVDENGKVNFSNRATININTDTGEVENMSCTEAAPEGKILFRTHFGHIGTPRDDREAAGRAMADKLAIYLRAQASVSHELVPETVIAKVGDNAFRADTLTVDGSAGELATLKGEL
ncbi:MAG: hypothetical protein Q7N50_15215, partial [Armatimonadota bacterium]|nr:hypothetical protein [Armatimonadota bacterium]